MPIMVRCGGGSGASMNYTVKAYAALADLPAAGKTNEIAVITSTAIGAHTFAVMQPTARADGTALQTGDMWLATGSQSNFPFNALKENGLYVYGQAATQYDGSAWQSVTAKIWYGGAWVDFNLYLYYMGNEYSSISGGWSANRSDGAVTFTKNSECLLITATGSLNMFAFRTELLDLTGYSTLKMSYTYSGATLSGNQYVLVGVGASTGITVANSLSAKVTGSSTIATLSLSISAVSAGAVYVGVNALGEAWNLRINSVMLER